MGYIKAECGKNRRFELDIEVKDCNSIECLSFVSGVADIILNNVACGNAAAFEGYKGLLIDEIEKMEIEDYENNI